MSVTVEALLRRIVQTAINILLMLKKMSRITGTERDFFRDLHWRSGLSQDLENAQKSQVARYEPVLLQTEELGPQLGSCEKGIPCISP